MRRIKRIVFAAAGIFLFAEGAAAAENIVLATASTGGSYYPVGVALSTAVTNDLAEFYDIRMSPITSGGSAENVDLIRLGEAQMAIMMGLYGRDGYTASGTRAGRPAVTNLRSIAALWQNVEQFVVRKDKIKSGTLADLGDLGTQFSIGPRNSGTEGTSRLVLGAVGIEPEKAFSVTNMKYDAAAEALQNGRIDGMSASAGVPTPSVAQAFVTSGDEIALLNVSDEQLDAISKSSGGLFTRAEIKAATYENQGETVQTIRQPNFLAVSADLSEETVYLITKAMFENLHKLQQANQAARAISMDDALQGLPVPLHPGAIRYYKDVGIDVPTHLMP
ncbi:TAXI family TRAP transporter solute-binding subunit [Thalassospira sp.]